MPEREYVILMSICAAGMAAKAAGAYRIWRDGLVSRLPALWILLLALCAQDVALMALDHDPRRAAEVFAWSSSIMLALEGLSVVWIFFAMTEKYRSFNWPRTILLSALALIGASVCWMAGFWAPPADRGGLQFALFAERNAGLVMLVMLAGTRVLLPRVKGIPIRRSARRASDILSLYVLTAFLWSTLAIATAAGYSFLQSLVPILNGATLGLLCAVCLTRESDVCDEAMTSPWVDDDDARKALMQIGATAGFGSKWGDWKTSQSFMQGNPRNWCCVIPL